MISLLKNKQKLTDFEKRLKGKYIKIFSNSIIKPFISTDKIFYRLDLPIRGILSIIEPINKETSQSDYVFIKLFDKYGCLLVNKNLSSGINITLNSSTYYLEVYKKSINVSKHLSIEISVQSYK